MHSTAETRILLKWLSKLPESAWWHLGETALWLETIEDLPPLPVLPAGLAVKFLDPSGDRPPLH